MADLVCIVGRLVPQNQLLQSFLTSSLDVDCTHGVEIDALSARLKPSEASLILWDFEHNDQGDLWSLLGTLIPAKDERRYMAVFNMPREYDQQARLVLGGVRGIFYPSDPLPILEKGIPAILKGEMWVPHKQLENCIKCNIGEKETELRGKEILTRREQQVLALMATGATNEEIAERLCISNFTVKTHNYRIFRKIGVSNRMQASLWAIQSQTGSAVSASTNARYPPEIR